MKRFIKIVFAFIALGTFALMFSSNVTAVNLTDEQMVEHDLSLVTVPDTAIISFPVAVKSPYGSQFKWSSSDEAVLEFMDGWFVVKRPSEEDAVVTVTVEVSRGEVSDIREFEVLVPAGETITRTFTITYLNVSEEEVAGLKKAYKLGEASFDLEDPIETGGKVFKGWFLDEDLTEEVTRVKVGTQGDLTFYAKWDVPATYKVVHYGEALEDGEYVVLETETFDSFVGREAIAKPLEFEGFTYAADHDLEVLEGVVPEEGILELKVYYTRNVYEVTFDTQGGSEIDPLTVKYGEAIEAPVPPTKVGYEFDGWNVEFPYEVKGDVTVTASWKAALVDYKVVYYGEKLDGTYEVVEEVFGEELTGTELTLTPDETFEGFEYFKHEGEVATQVIAADGTSEFAFYYKRLEFTVTFDLDGGSWDDIPTVVTYKYGAEVVKPERTPLREGHAFAGWDVAFPFTMPAEDVVVTAQWTELDIWIVTFDSQGGSQVSTQEVIDGGTALKPEDPEKVGYTFVGWFTEEDVEFDFDTPITASITLYAHWEAAEVDYVVEHYLENIENDEYTITDTTYKKALADGTVTEYALQYTGFTAVDSSIEATVLADGSLVIKFYYTRNEYTITVITNDQQDDIVITAKYQAPVNAPELTREGYEFAGWDVDFPETMPLGGLTVNASWTAVEYTITYVIENPYELEFTNPNPVKYTIEDLVQLVALVVGEDGVFVGWFADEAMTIPIAEITKGTIGDITVYGLIRYTDEKIVELDRALLLDKYQDLLAHGKLDIEGIYGSTIQWQSDNTTYSVDKYGFVTVIDSQKDEEILLVATIAYGNHADQVVYDFVIPADYMLRVDFMIDGVVEFSHVILNGEELAEVPVDPEKAGFEFLYWSNEPAGDAFDLEKPITSDLTLFAVWAKIHTVKFMDGDEELYNVQVLDLEVVEQPAEPTKDGFLFLYWSSEVDGDPYEFNTPVIDDLVLYAVWEEETSGGFADDLFISEYIEGSSDNKAIEIFNGTGKAVDLSEYKVELYVNGKSDPSNTVQLEGTLAHGEVYVIYNSSASSEIKDKGNLAGTVCNFNGDDALVLKKNDEVIDSFGQVGDDPGSYWGDNNIKTADMTLVRKPKIISGRTNYMDDFDPSEEWIAYPQDTFNYLGSHECVIPEVELTPEQKIAAAIAEIDVLEEVVTDLVLPTSGAHGVTIAWSSNNAAINAATGKVTRPAVGEEDVTVTLTATFSLDDVEVEVEYIVIVKAKEEETGGGEPVTVTASYSGATGNMGDGNNAELIGLDPSIFDVLSQKGGQNNHVGLNKDGQIRLYYHNSGNGNTLSISIASGYKITGIEFKFGSSGTSAKVNLGGVEEPISSTSKQTIPYSDLEISNFSIQNTGASQIYILSITITYVSVN